ncbi:MAG: Na+/H+ antiporter NhaA [Aggregatilineales bacterium]|mgnify:CR=1 FL=1|nr:Na+/H+ antiporter NhaA [Aggregatilineales bacterium]
MAANSTAPSLIPPVDLARDHIRGPEDAPVILVEYGDFQCPHCGAVKGILSELEERLGEHYRYVFRHFPLTDRHPHAQLAAEAAEAAGAQGKFWEMHDRLFQAGPLKLSRANLVQYAREIGLDVERFERELDEGVYTERVREDFESGLKSGVTGTPSFFINGKRYRGPWDVDSLQAAIENPLGARVRRIFSDFMQLETSGGIVLMIAALIALIWANSPWSDLYFNLWATKLAISIGNFHLEHDLVHWVNDGLMAIFFFVVGLEIKREVLVGELSKPRKAILPLMAGVGGMLVPALLYTLINAGGPGASGWGVPMATDIAFMLGVMALLGSRVPLSIKIFFTALAIADDLGAVLVIALFYSDGIQLMPLLVGLAIFAVMVVLSVWRVYKPIPYALLGLGLWYSFLISGVHPTIAGVLAAMTIPARRTVNASAFVAQLNMILREFDEPYQRIELGAHGGVRQAALQTVNRISSQLESPLQRLERSLHPWTTYAIIPIFALANAGVDLRGDLLGTVTHPISIGIILGLVLGKSTGITLLSWIAVKLGLGDLPDGVSWKQLYAVSWLGGIGFTMSLFIASTEFTGLELAGAKAGIFLASLLAGVIGAVLVNVLSDEHTEVTEMEPSPAYD